jgi:phosphoribosylanthranilate isomerase
MTWVKICGITNLEDARTAVDAGANALGFVFWERSPRKIDPKTARQIVKQLPEEIEKVGVFVDTPLEVDSDICSEAQLTAHQRQFFPFTVSLPEKGGAYSGVFFYRGGLKAFKVISVSCILADQKRLHSMVRMFEHWEERITPEARPGLSKDTFETFFLDAGTVDQPGGTGKTFDWNKALPLVEAMRPKVKVVVAGGLNPTNVGEAIRLLRPWGVDVSSGVETRLGKKDPEKVRAFVKAVREAEKSA